MGAVAGALLGSSWEGQVRQGKQPENWLVWVIPAGSQGQGLSLVVWCLPWGDEGRWTQEGRQWRCGL